MNGGVQDFVARCVENYPIAGRVLEVGSRDICGSARRWFTKDGQQKEPTERFPEYIGIDIVPGNLVDVIMDAHQMRFPDESFDIAISTSALEHDSDPFQTIAEIRRVLRPGGWLILTVPGWRGQGPHCEHDYWRFMPEGVDLMLRQQLFDIIELIDHVDTIDVFALARKRF